MVTKRSSPMWYPTFPDVMYLQEQVCALQEVDPGVREMAAIDEAILAPQRTGGEERSLSVVARKTAALVFPLVKGEPFNHCGDRITHALAQRFADRNGFVFQASFRDMTQAFEKVRSEEVSLDTFSDWIGSRLSTRFDSSHRERIFSCLNQLAQVKEDLEQRPGLHREVDQIDAIGYTLAQQADTLFRLENGHTELRDRFPLFWEAWDEALNTKR